MDACLTLCTMLRNAANSCEREFTAVLEKSGISHCQAFLLLALSGGRASVSDVSRALCCSCGNITQIVDQLAKKGLVRRVHSAEDRRTRGLELTAKGQTARGIVERILRKQAGACCGMFSAQEKVQLKKMLSAYLAHHQHGEE